MIDLWFDTETFSECELKGHGTFRYAEHESTEIMVAQWAIGDGEPVVEDLTRDGGHPSQALMDHLRNPEVIIHAHNSMFDRTLVREVWGLDLPPERWYDVMVQALSHSLPGALGKLGPALGLPVDQQKDQRGGALIQLFCKPRPVNHKARRANWQTHPEEWAEFLEYSRQDIPAMRNVSKVMPKWNYRFGCPNWRHWCLDQRVNDRGFAVDLDLADAAVQAVAKEQRRLKDRVIEETEGAVTSLSKRDQILAYILEEYGVALVDLKGATLRAQIDNPDLPPQVRSLLLMRQEATKTSTAKYKALLKAASWDSRLRNTLQFCGALRTGRWAGRIFQPQNMPRPSMEADEIAEGIECLKMGVAPYFFDNTMKLTANAVRGAIVAAPGTQLVVADLSNIEGRMLAWLAGERWKLKAFANFDVFKLDDRGQKIPDGKGDWLRHGFDLYILAYARAFNLSPDQVEKWQRQIGKVMELGLGYEGGVAAFLTFAAVYNMDLDKMANAVWDTAPPEAIENAKGMYGWAKKKGFTRGLPERLYIACEVLKRAWRDAHPNVEQLWGVCGDAARAAIREPGVLFGAGQHLQFRRDGSWLRMRLPSGRVLCYPNPRVGDENGDGEDISYMGVDQFTHKWQRVKTYGGKLVENATQAVACDVLRHSAPLIETAGFKIVLSVHDEFLTEAGFDRTSEELSAIMAAPVPWAPGLPLAAAGFTDVRYRKG